MAKEDDALKKLEYLSLISKVCSELDTHVGTSDKVLAEFITDLGRKCRNVDEFDAQLKKFDCDLPDYLVKSLLIIIHAILPPKPKPNCGVGSNDDKEFRIAEMSKRDERDNRVRNRNQRDDFGVNPSGEIEGKPRVGLSGISIVEEENCRPVRRSLKRMSSPEKWETQQLIASGVLCAKEFSSFDDEGDGVVYDEGVEEEFEIELNDDEPPLLDGKTRNSVDMSPVKILGNREGWLNSAAAIQSALSKEMNCNLPEFQSSLFTSS